MQASFHRPGASLRGFNLVKRMSMCMGHISACTHVGLCQTWLLSIVLVFISDPMWRQSRDTMLTPVRLVRPSSACWPVPNSACWPVPNSACIMPTFAWDRCVATPPGESNLRVLKSPKFYPLTSLTSQSILRLSTWVFLVLSRFIYVWN